MGIIVLTVVFIGDHLKKIVMEDSIVAIMVAIITQGNVKDAFLLND